MAVRRDRASAPTRAAVSAARAGASTAGRRSPGAPEALWLSVLQRIAGRAAHELKGALNGASVNLEVVRSRAEAPERAGDGIARYANAAATQLEAVITMSDALLALARSARDKSVLSAGAGGAVDDIATMLRRMIALLEPSLRIGQGTLVVDEPLGAVNASAVQPMLVRALLGAALLAATEQWHHTRCSVDPAANRVLITRRDGTLSDGALSIEQEILDAAADAGIQVQMDGSAITMTFPRGDGGRNMGISS